MISNTKSKEESVKVVVRCRPISETEKLNKHPVSVKIDGQLRSIQLAHPDKKEDSKQFTFDDVLGPECAQSQLYEKTAYSLVDAVLHGYNGTLFAYGQSGSGKTFSVLGAGDLARRDGTLIQELDGIIPRAINQIFSYINTQGNASTRFLVRASFFEIYNEEIRDLFQPSTKRLELKESPNGGFYVKDGSTFVVQNEFEMLKLLKTGIDRRATASTGLNDVSSRSHSIFTVTVEMATTEPSNNNGKEHIKVGKLHLVDLAGSERQAKTQATGDRLKEAAKINLSLTALGNVIAALAEGKTRHVPYRDSKLTKLLMDSLGGNSKTVMVATISPVSYNFDESLSTLRYANRAKQIKNQPKINEDPKDAMLREFQDEIQRLKEQLAGLENGNQESQSEQTEAAQDIGKFSDAQLLELEDNLAKEKSELMKEQGMLEDEKRKLLEALNVRSAELEKEKQEREALAKKLEQMQAKLLVGGVNLIDQLQEHEQQLKQHSANLEEQRKREEDLRKKLEEQEMAILKSEESFSSLQEEANAKTEKLKKLWNLVMKEKQEILDVQESIDRDKEILKETAQRLISDLKLKTLMVKTYIPEVYRRYTEQNSKYNESSGTWEIPNVHLTGNLLKDKRGDLRRGKQRYNADASGEKIRKLFEDPVYLFPDCLLSYNENCIQSTADSSSLNLNNPKNGPQARGMVNKKTTYA